MECAADTGQTSGGVAAGTLPIGVQELPTAGVAAAALQQVEADLLKEKQARAEDQALFQKNFEAVVTQAMEAEGLRDKATMVATHIAEKVRLYERHSDEQERRATMFQAQVEHLVQRYTEQCRVLTEERDATQHKCDKMLHQLHVFEQSSTVGLQERTNALNRVEAKRIARKP